MIVVLRRGGASFIFTLPAPRGARVESLTLLGLAFLTYVKGWGGANMPPLLLTIYLKIEHICFRVIYLLAKIEGKKWSSFFPYLKYLVMAAT